MSQYPELKQGDRIPSDLSFYNNNPPIKDSARNLLKEYSNIPENEIDGHVEDIRQRAFKIFPYPCIGSVRFLDLSICTQPVYGDVLDRLKSGEKLLDLGCCFGQEIRQLILDGAPAENIYGSDLQQEFIDLGYELFKDQSSLKTEFIVADVFDPNSALSRLNGQMNIVYTGSFFHLFSFDQQVAAAKRVVEILAPAKGSMLVGRHVGNEKPGSLSVKNPDGSAAIYHHDIDSWRALWEDIGRQTGTEWDIRIEWDASQMDAFGSGNVSVKDQGEPRARRMTYVMTRL